LPKRNYYKVP
ncbi:hypothetical protein KGM_210196B, partial [Danaus plexippus plexippus]